MPGFLAGLAVSRAEGVGAAVLTSTSTGAKAEDLAVQLTCAALDAYPGKHVAWTPGEEPPLELQELLGLWWTEGNELVFSHRDGRFQAELVNGPAGRRVSWFERESPICSASSRVASAGTLRVVRDDAGAVLKLYFATYPVTRAPQTFGNSVGDRIDPVPNTVSYRSPAL